MYSLTQAQLGWRKYTHEIIPTWNLTKTTRLRHVPFIIFCQVPELSCCPIRYYCCQVLNNTDFRTYWLTMREFQFKVIIYYEGKIDKSVVPMRFERL